jgi:hypothetical protein
MGSIQESYDMVKAYGDGNGESTRAEDSEVLSRILQMLTGLNTIYVEGSLDPREARAVIKLYDKAKDMRRVHIAEEIDRLQDQLNRLREEQSSLYE